jgi:Flp pilus assembly protein CpaB
VNRANDSSTTAEATVTVVVAKQAIPEQWIVREPEKYGVLRPVPVSRVPKECLRSLKALKNVRVGRAFAEGQAIDANAIEGPECLGGSDIPPARVAVPLRIRSTSITGDVVRPGAKADVVWVYSVPLLYNGGRESGIKTILTDVPVVAVDKLGKCKDGARPQTVELLVTFETSRKDAVEFKLAVDNGEIRLRVKSPGDDPTKER